MKERLFRWPVGRHLSTFQVGFEVIYLLYCFDFSCNTSNTQFWDLLKRLNQNLSQSGLMTLASLFTATTSLTEASLFSHILYWWSLRVHHFHLQSWNSTRCLTAPPWNGKFWLKSFGPLGSSSRRLNLFAKTWLTLLLLISH